MLRNILPKFLIAVSIILSSSIIAQDADPIEAARQAKLAAEKAAADAEAATGAAIEAAAAKAAAAAREKVIADREAEKARKLAEKEAAENAEIDAAAEAAALEARRRLAAELGLELEEVPDSSVSELVELSNSENDTTTTSDSPLKDFTFGAAPSLGFASGEAFSNIPVGATVVISTPYGFKVGPLDLKVSLGFGSYTGDYNGASFNPIYAGIGANGILSGFIFSESHVGLVGKGLGIRQFAGITLERLMKRGLDLPVNILIGGEGFISTDIDGNDITTGWGGLGMRLDYTF